MNELKLSLQNFQSISEGELTFKTGLNFIIGQSNSGKSATFRALKACLLNPAGSQRFIKRDSGKAIVTLKYNGNDICWNKTEKANSYNINGEEYRNTGKSDAFKILNDETGFVKAEKGCALMNIEEELQLPFPFGIPDSELFKLFENVFCVSDSAVILKSAKEHEDTVKNDISMLELEEAKIQAKVNALTRFKEEINIKDLKSQKDFLETLLNNLLFFKDGLEDIKIAVKLEEDKIKINQREFPSLIERHQDLIECKEILRQTTELHKLFKTLNKKEIIFNSKLEELRTLEELKSILRNVKELRGLNVPVNSYKSILDNYEEFLDINKTLQNLKKLHKFKVGEESFENKLTVLRDLKTTRSYIDKIKGQIQELKANKKREEEKVASMEEKLKEFKVCPLCHHSLES